MATTDLAAGIILFTRPDQPAETEPFELAIQPLANIAGVVHPQCLAENRSRMPLDNTPDHPFSPWEASSAHTESIDAHPEQEDHRGRIARHLATDADRLPQRRPSRTAARSARSTAGCRLS